MPAPRQRHALAALFTVLMCAFAALAVASAWGAGDSARRWLVAAASGALAAWFAVLAAQLVRRT